MTLLTMFGRSYYSFVNYLGSLAMLLAEIIESLVRGKIRMRKVIAQVYEIGYSSQPVVIITGAFTGAVLAAQGLFQLQGLGMESMGGAMVSVGMLRELGPTLTGLMLAGRVGAAMSAEIGTMQVTEQIDALRSMSVHPVDFLVTPRLIAMMLSVPLLITESAAFGILASWVVGTQAFGVPEAWWEFRTSEHTDMSDIYIALVKGAVFGFLIVLISCNEGLKASRGAVGVGQGTTRAMVFSSLAILITNFFLTMLMNLVFPTGVAG
ncbi:MlaE family ABC transporter permease [Persicirhabdus sediminis]|uniref:ABC transporter permease n=1 Tax=Persicirhabdus sediminis TaxID=454144 RepID=A0A8J7ME44_9BACT|nr:ABC transporter permease [Persicirhabdus sediminis]MBK1792204.1 ABC transporter permease [Persicirhabdus sediminis]